MPTSRPRSTKPLRQALDRGAAAVAAELCEHALRLTPPDAHEERHRRALAAARAHQVAGEWTRARTIATDLLAETEIGSWRVEALILLAELEHGDRAAELLAEALREAASRPALRVAHSLSPGVGDALQHRVRPRALPRSSWPNGLTTTSSACAPAPCWRSSTGSPASRRRPAISRRWPSTSRRRSAASGWYRRRRRRS